MSLKLRKKLSSKRKKLLKDSPQEELLCKLGLENSFTLPLDPKFMQDIHTWNLKNQAPIDHKDLPKVFLRRLWLHSQDARTPSVQSQHVTIKDSTSNVSQGNSPREDSQSLINPLDLVTSVFMSADPFLQQELAVHMMQCQFAVPLILPNIEAEKPGQFLLWPFRAVTGKLGSHLSNSHTKIQELNLAVTSMPMISCVKFGFCSISKSQVMNHLLNGLELARETFVHKGMLGCNLPRRLSNGLVEIGWHIPTEENCEIYPFPVMLSNLRGNASMHEKYLYLLCQMSSVVVVFCGNLGEKEKQLLTSCKDMATKLILIDLSETERTENGVVGFVDQRLEDCEGISRDAILSVTTLNEKEIASKLSEKLKSLPADSLTPVSLETAANVALEIGMSVDEGPVCKKAMAAVEEVLKGVDEGLNQFCTTQLPLQNVFWNKLSELDKREHKQTKEGKEPDLLLQMEKDRIVASLKTYKMTPAMKVFTDSLATPDRMERAYFLAWLGQRLYLSQNGKNRGSHQSVTTSSSNQNSFLRSDSVNPQSAASGDVLGSEESSTEEKTGVQPPESNVPGQLLEHVKGKKISGEIIPGFESKANKSPISDHMPFSLGVEDFLFEMGLIFELTHASSNSMAKNVQRLPSLAADLLHHGYPLQVMNGKTCNIPTYWLSSVLAELKRHLPQSQLGTRVLTNLGKNSDFFSNLLGVKFPEKRRPTSKGLYIITLEVPNSSRKDLGCDLLLLMSVAGASSFPAEESSKALIQDNAMATVATALSDVIIQDVSQYTNVEFESTFNILVSTLLRSKECGCLPGHQLLVQDESFNSKLQTSQLKRVCKMLQTTVKHKGSATYSAIFVKEHQSTVPYLKVPSAQYTEALLNLKENLFGAIKRCAAGPKVSILPNFMEKVSTVWDTVKLEAFSISLQDTVTALAFSLLCTEFSEWEDTVQENMKTWLTDATKKIFATSANVLDTDSQNKMLSSLRNEAKEVIASEMGKIRSKAEDSLATDDTLKGDVGMLREVLVCNIANLQDRETKDVMQKLETICENHCSFKQLRKFESLLQEEQEFKLLALSETSKSTKILFQDSELDEEFEVVWSKTLSNFAFRPSETDDITSRVKEVLKLNLVSRGLHKHLKKMDDLGKNQVLDFQVNDEHFGYRSRLKHMFEDNNRQQRIEAHQIASKIREDYDQFVAQKSTTPADFSESYIVELLGNIEKTLKENCMDIRSAFEVDLKVYLCNAACQDFQRLHDRFAKDKEVLSNISKIKDRCQAEFIYFFRKRDQCQRIALAFVSMVIKPIVLDFIYRPLGMQIVREIKEKYTKYQSPQKFQQSLLEDLLQNDEFESFLEYSQFNDNFRKKKIQKTVMDHISESSTLNKWRQQRLGEIIGKVAAAVNQTPESTIGELTDTKPLLERACFILEKDADVSVSEAALNGPLFSITTEWDQFVKCVMELLATMRMDLSQEFAQNVDVTQLLQSVSDHPDVHLFEAVRGCNSQCPLCSAPCGQDEPGHNVHKALIHWPQGMSPYDTSTLSQVISSETTSSGHNGEAQLMYNMCENVQHLHPHWSNSSDKSKTQKTNNYWRYMLVRINEKLAAHFQQEPAEIPKEWKKITLQEALVSLKDVFSSE